MWMSSFFREVKKQLRDVYKLTPDREENGEPCFNKVLDNVYPITIENKTYYIAVSNNRFYIQEKIPPPPKDTRIRIPLYKYMVTPSKLAETHIYIVEEVDGEKLGAFNTLDLALDHIRDLFHESEDDPSLNYKAPTLLLIDPQLYQDNKDTFGTPPPIKVYLDNDPPKPVYLIYRIKLESVFPHFVWKPDWKEESQWIKNL